MGMSGAGNGSPSPLVFPADGGTRAGDLKLPRKVLQSEISENAAQAAPGHNDTISTNTSGTPVQVGSSGAASLEQGQATQRSDLREDGEHVSAITYSPETIHYNLLSDANSESVDSGLKQGNRTVQTSVTTTTRVEERKSKNVQKTGQSTTARGEAVQPRRSEVQSSQGVVSRRGSLYFERRPSTTTTTVETRRFAVPSKPSFIVEDSLEAIQQSHRHETDHMLIIMRARLEEHKQYERIYEEQLQDLQVENERLVLQVSSLTSEITLLRIRADNDDRPGSPSSYGEPDVTVTTTITTVTTMITSVTTRIEQWKETVIRNNGQITILRGDLDRLLSDLSDTSSQMTKLRQSYLELSKGSSSVRHRLEMTSTLLAEKESLVTSLTAEVVQLKNANAALRRDNDRIRNDTSVASSLKARIAELERSRDALSEELDSAHDELQAKVSSIEEMESTIVSRTAEVTRLKQSEAEKTKQNAALRQDYEKFRRDSSFQIAELREGNGVLTKELESVRNELREKMTHVEERDNKVVVLNAEVEKWKSLDVTKTQQLDAERRDKEKLQQKLAAFSSQIANLEERCKGQSEKVTSLHHDLQTKESLLVEKQDTITSITTERDQARREIAVKDQQVTAARKEVEQLRNKVSVALGEKADLQKRFDAQLIELDKLHNELGRLRILLKEPGAHGDDIAQRIAAALEEKEKQIGVLRREHAAATSRISELEKSHEDLLSKIRALNTEWTAEKSRYEGTITSLNDQVKQLRDTVADKTKQTTTALNQVQELQVKLSTSTAQLTELQGRYATQSEKLTSVTTELQAMALSIQAKDHDISSLTAERDRLTSANAAKADQITKLQQELSVSTTQLPPLQDRLKLLLDELASVKSKLKISESSNEEKDRKVLALADEIAELKHVNALGEERIATLGEQVEELQQELTNSRSQVAKLQHDIGMQLKELESLQERLKAVESGDNASISSLRVQVEEWRKSCTTKGEELMAARGDADQLRHELDILSSRFDALQQELTSQTKRWQQLDATKTADLTTARAELQQLRHELDTSSLRVVELEQELARKTAELTTARNELDKLRPELSESSSKIREYKSRVTELTSQADRLKGELATVREELKQSKQSIAAVSADATALKHQRETLSAELELLKEQFSFIPPDFKFEGSVEWSTFTERIIAEVKDHTDIIKLTSTVDEWLRADAKRAEVLALELEKRNKENEELRRNFVTLKEIYIRAPRLKQIFQSDTIEIKRRYEGELNTLKSTLAESQSQLKGVQRVVATADTYADEAIKQELLRLNAEVEQNTTLMAEDIASGFQPRTTKAIKEEFSRVSKTIGPTLAKALGTMQRDDAALYLSIAFQAYFSYYLCQMIPSWTTEQGHNEFISKIYDKLQDEETQPMSGRWRALTRAYISPTWMSDPDSLTQQIVAALSDVVVVAKCAASTSAATSKLSSFGNKVKSIISIAGQFSQMVGKVVSADFMVLAPRPSQKFEAATMEVDDYGDDQGKVGETATGKEVLCSTYLGMAKRMQRESGKETLTVIKAKVALESFLDS